MTDHVDRHPPRGHRRGRSVAVTLRQAPRVLRRPAPAAPGTPAGGRRGVTAETALAAVTALILLNQLLVTVYLLRVHDGDASFVARLLPPGWFDLADGPTVRALAAHVPAPELLAPSLLRVPALLELPFVLLVFLAVLRRLDPVAYRQAALSPLLGLAAASYTAVFCTVEWQLRTPWTEQDIAIRLLSAVLTPPAVAALVRRDARAARTPAGPPGTSGLLLFAVDLAALGHLVLTVYDTALLYNLGRLPGAPRRGRGGRRPRRHRTAPPPDPGRGQPGGAASHRDARGRAAPVTGAVLRPGPGDPVRCHLRDPAARRRGRAPRAARGRRPRPGRPPPCRGARPAPRRVCGPARGVRRRTPDGGRPLRDGAARRGRRRPRRGRADLRPRRPAHHGGGGGRAALSAPAVSPGRRCAGRGR
ncbi:hypothetical protein ACFQ1I_44340 [Kitasatospora arboriphila]